MNDIRNITSLWFIFCFTQNKHHVCVLFHVKLMFALENHENYTLNLSTMPYPKERKSLFCQIENKTRSIFYVCSYIGEWRGWTIMKVPNFSFDPGIISVTHIIDVSLKIKLSNRMWSYSFTSIDHMCFKISWFLMSIRSSSKWREMLNRSERKEII